MSSRNNLLLINTFFALCLLGTAGLLLYQYTHRSPPDYFSVSYSGVHLPLVAHNTPNVSSKSLLSWATLAATAAYSFDFVNYQKQLNDLAPFFTKEGYQRFLNAVDQAHIITDLRDKKLIMSAVPIGTPTIVNEGVVLGEYTWVVQLPVAIKYQSASEETTEYKAVALIISRVSPDIASRGIGIKSLQDAIYTPT